MKDVSKNYDVIIIGAGPSGIFCAYELIEKKPDLSQENHKNMRRLQTMLHHHRLCRSRGIFRRKIILISRRRRKSS